MDLSSTFKLFFTMTKSIIIKSLLFYLGSFIIFVLLVKMLGDFPTYPPTEKGPITWPEVWERLDFIFFGASLTTLIYLYALYASDKRKK
jgi:hypothetical protein